MLRLFSQGTHVSSRRWQGFFWRYSPGLALNSVASLLCKIGMNTYVPACQDLSNQKLPVSEVAMFFMIFFNHLSDPGSGNTHNLISSHWRGSAPPSPRGRRETPWDLIACQMDRPYLPIDSMPPFHALGIQSLSWPT